MDNQLIIDRIKQHYHRDMAKNASAEHITDIPIAYDNITPRWLNAVLGKHYPGLEVVDYTWGNIDDGSSNRRKLHVTYRDQSIARFLPNRFFCKAAHGLENRVVIGVSGAAHSEVLFYNRLKPFLDIETPICYHADVAQESGLYIVMLKDLSDDGVVFCNHQTPMTVALAQSQISLLATMHGAGYSNVDLQHHLNDLPSWPEFFENTLSFGMEQGCKSGFLAAQSVIPERLFKQRDAIWPATVDSVNHHHHLPLTLTHGDVHLKNWYITQNKAMGLGDWQCANRGHWSRDFAYTISTALTPEQRREWEQDLLKMYLERLEQAGGPYVSFSEAWDLYREQLLGALAWWTVTLSPPEGVADMQPEDTSREFIRRISTAIDDLNAMSLFN